MMTRAAVALAAASTFGICAAAHADRIVLAPSGLVASANTARAQYLASDRAPHADLSWVTFGVPDNTLGLEMEAEGINMPGKHDATFSAQYSFTGNAFVDVAPALSVGIRDALNNGREGRAVFVAAAKQFGMSERQEKVLRNWTLNVGYGSSHIGGGYIGLQGRFAAGFTGNVEYMARRFNASVAVPLTRHLAFQAASLDGHAYLGASLNIAR